MYSKLWFPLLAFMLMFRACTPVRSAKPVSRPRDVHAAQLPDGSGQQTQASYAPVDGDAAMQRGYVKIDSLVLLVSEGYPHQYQLEMKGTLPTPCHQLRVVVEEPNVESDIHVQVYSIYDPYTVCTQVQNPFDASFPLGEYVRGSYTVIVNGKDVTEIVP